ncbi:4'-phosphopantetheinyl transferase family protein [Thalassospira alkalitolerans]|uniref:4'-phosphopantetheinyl transferase family protein n=1 Tax=Thalassospira alkalitolerans TaxID=1293890 RepID=UPI003AA8D2C4
MSAPELIRTHSLVLHRPNGAGRGVGSRMQTGTFPTDILRATLAVVDLDLLDAAQRDAQADILLHSAEQARMAGFAHDRRRQSFTCGRIAAKTALVAHCPEINPREIEIGSGVFDQPILTTDQPGLQGLAISISHSDQFAVAMVFHQAHPMGIDVDLPTAKDMPAVLAGLAPGVAGIIRRLGLDDIAGASLLWVARESLAKTLTTGMMTPLDVYAPASIETDGVAYIVRYANFGQYRSIIWPGKRGWLALTLPDQTLFDPARLPWS